MHPYWATEMLTSQATGRAPGTQHTCNQVQSGPVFTPPSRGTRFSNAQSRRLFLCMKIATKYPSLEEGEDAVCVHRQGLEVRGGRGHLQDWHHRNS